MTPRPFWLFAIWRSGYADLRAAEMTHDPVIGALALARGTLLTVLLRPLWRWVRTY